MLNANEVDLINKLTHIMSKPNFLSATEIADMLSCEPRTVRENYALRKGFPKVHYLPEGDKGRGAKRYFESDVIEWMKGLKG